MFFFLSLIIFPFENDAFFSQPIVIEKLYVFGKMTVCTSLFHFLRQKLDFNM